MTTHPSTSTAPDLPEPVRKRLAVALAGASPVLFDEYALADTALAVLRGPDQPTPTRDQLVARLTARFTGQPITLGYLGPTAAANLARVAADEFHGSGPVGYVVARRDTRGELHDDWDGVVHTDPATGWAEVDEANADGGGPIWSLYALTQVTR